MRFIKLYQKLEYWRHYKDANTKALFIHLLLSAEWRQPEDYEQYGTPELSAGQVKTSIRDLSKDTGLSVQNIRTSLSKLSQISQHSANTAKAEIAVKSTHLESIITINNYNEFQGRENASQHSANTAKPKKPQKLTHYILYNIEYRTIELLEQALKNDIIDVNNENKILEPKDLEMFILHWTQRTKNNKNIKQQQEKTWNPKLRLMTWKKNNDNWDKKKPYEKPKGEMAKLG